MNTPLYLFSYRKLDIGSLGLRKAFCTPQLDHVVYCGVKRQPAAKIHPYLA